MVVLVDDAREVGHHDGRAPLRGGGDVPGVGVRDEVGGGQHHEVVAVEVRTRRHHVGRDAAAPQRAVPGLHLVHVPQRLRGVGVELGAPPRRPVHDHRRPGTHARTAHLAERLEGVAQGDDVAPQVRVPAGMRDHGRVVLLGAGPGLAPLEEHHRVGAARDVLQRVAQELPGQLGAVAGLPVDRRGRVLHQDPGVAARDPAGQVRGEREVDVPLRVGRGRVVVVGHDVQLRGPGEIVHALGVAGRHQVRGHRHVRRDLPQGVTQVAVVVEQRVRGEPVEVELLGGVGVRGRDERGEDVVERAVTLRPERGAPRLVERVDRGVPLAQPLAEGVGGGVGVVAGDVAADLVVHVPQRQRGVVPVALGHARGHPQRVLPVDRMGDGVRLPPALVQHGPVREPWQDLGVRARQPRWR